MRDNHWTEDELIAALYGVGPEDGHLERCADCRAKADRLSRSHLDLVQAEPMVASERLAAQRRTVLARIEGRPRWWSPVRWIPLTAAAVAVVMVLLVRPFDWGSAPLVTQKASVADTQLFEDAFAKAYSIEPAASQPLQALFEEKQ